MNQENSNPRNRAVRNHNWMFEQIIRSQFGPSESLRQALTDEQLSLIDADKAELLSTKTTSPDNSLQDADAVIRVPLKEHGTSGIRIRYLIEHKSSIDINKLTSQLLRYQYGLYEISKEPIVTIVINNGPVSKYGEQLSFHDWIDDPGEAFWQIYGDYLLRFNVLILNLKDPDIQRRLLSSQSPAALGLYAMGKAVGEFDREKGLEMLRKLQELDTMGIDQIWLPVVDYLKYCHPEITIDWWTKLELEETGESRVMAMALSSLEQRYEDGRQEGIQEGIQENNRDVAKRMLRDGIDEKFVSKYTELSETEIRNLKEEG